MEDVSWRTSLVIVAIVHVLKTCHGLKTTRFFMSDVTAADMNGLNRTTRIVNRLASVTKFYAMQ